MAFGSGETCWGSWPCGPDCAEECVCSFFDPFTGIFNPTPGYTEDSTASGGWTIEAGRARGTASSSLTVSTARPALSGLQMGASVTTYNWPDPALGGTSSDLWGLLFNGTRSDLVGGNNFVEFTRQVAGVAPISRVTLKAVEPGGTVHSSVVDLGDGTTHDAIRLRITVEDVSSGAGTYDIKGYADGVLVATLSAVPLTLGANVDIGFYQNAGGEFDDFCIAACNPAVPDVCPLCDATDSDPSWLQNTTLDTDLATDAGVIGDCLSIDPCAYYGRQLFLPETMTSTECAWASCSEVPSCDSVGAEFDGGPAARIFTETVASVDLLVEEWYVYSWNGSAAVATVIGRWEAPQSDICGPATLTKTVDLTTGSYLPATITITRTPTASCRPLTPCGAVEAGPYSVVILEGTIAGEAFKVCMPRGADANCAPTWGQTLADFTGGTCVAEDIVFLLYCDGAAWQLDVTIGATTVTVAVTLDDPGALYGTVSGTLTGLCGGAALVADLSACGGLPDFPCYTGDQAALCCFDGATLVTQGVLFGDGIDFGTCTGDADTASVSYGNPTCTTTGLPVWASDRWYVQGAIPITTPSGWGGKTFVVSCDGGTTVAETFDSSNCVDEVNTVIAWDWDTFTGTIELASATDDCTGGGGGAYRIEVG